MILCGDWDEVLTNSTLQNMGESAFFSILPIRKESSTKEFMRRATVSLKTCYSGQQNMETMNAFGLHCVGMNMKKSPYQILGKSTSGQRKEAWD